MDFKKEHKVCWKYLCVQYITNDVQIIAHVICKIDFQKLQINNECNIKEINKVYPCPHCSNYVTIKSLTIDNLSINHIAYLETSQKFVSFPGEIFQGKDNYFGLAKYIGYYASKEYELIKLPVKNFRY